MSEITFGSVCSGIEAASVAWIPLDMRADWLSEIEPFPSAVLRQRYPLTPNLGNMTTLPDKVLKGEITAPDILVGGTPCQSFSVAGLREGMQDERGLLTMKYVELLDAIDFIRQSSGEPLGISVWENVPGVLSSKDNAFGCFLGALAGEDCELQPSGRRWSNAGYVLGPKRAVAWRVLDAQYFGVAQRRRRVFVVASARDGFDPAKVLFEFDGVRRDIAPCPEAGQEIAGNARGGAKEPSFLALNSRQDPVSGDVFGSLDACSPQAQAIAYGCTPTKLNGVANTITASYGRGGADLETKPLALVTAIADDVTPKTNEELAFTLSATGFKCPQAVHQKAVRRLTPVECERLQGFPDNYTQISWRNKPADECPDGHRYKALGNSMAVPVMRWIGRRIEMELAKEVKA